MCLHTIAVLEWHFEWMKIMEGEEKKKTPAHDYGMKCVVEFFIKLWNNVPMNDSCAFSLENILFLQYNSSALDFANK